MAFSTNQQNSSERYLSEIANKIKQTNKELCCLNNNIIPQTPQDIINNDYESICYSTDNGINILNGWKRFEIINDTDNNTSSVTTTIYNKLNVEVANAIEFPCLDYNYIAGCKVDKHNVDCSFGLTPVSTTLLNIDVLPLEFGPDPLASNVDSASEFYLVLPDCSIVNLINSIGGSSTPIDIADYPNTPLKISLVLKTKLHFEFIFSWNNISASGLSVDSFITQCSNSNASDGVDTGISGILPYYYTNFESFYTKYDNTGQFIEYVALNGSPISFGPSAYELFSECLNPLETKCDTGCIGLNYENTFGITVTGNATTNPPVMDKVTSLTVLASTGDVTITTSSGSIILKQGFSHSFTTSSNNNYLNTSAMNFKGSLPGSLYNVYGSYI